MLLEEGNRQLDQHGRDGDAEMPQIPPVRLEPGVRGQLRDMQR